MNHKDSSSHNALAQLENDESEYMWISGINKQIQPIHHALKNLEADYLRCPICHEFYRNAVYIKSCHHTFCSECIRIAFKNGLATLRRKQDCPVCKMEVKDENTELIPDFGLQRCVSQFQELRGLLKSSLDIPNGTNGTSIPSIETRHTKRTRTTHPNGIKSRNEEVTAIGQPMQRKPTPHYHGMKKKQLETLCRDAGLLSSGSDEELIERHRSFVLLWNAECDSETPMSEADIVRQVSLREESRKKETIRQSMISNKGQNVQDGFRALIEQVRVQKGAPAKVASGMDNTINIVSTTDEMKIPAMMVVIDMSSDSVSGVMENTVFEPRSETKSCNDIKGETEASSTCQSSNHTSDEVHTKIDLSMKLRGGAICYHDGITIPSPTLSNHTYNSKTKLSSEQSIIGPWYCPQCTFHNVNRKWKNAKCEMCTFPRPSNNA